MKVAILGCGGMGRVHGSKYQAMPGVLPIFVDRTPERAQELAEKLGGEAMDWPAALEAADAVDICLPTDLHIDAAIEAIEAGKPVLVEKPLGRTVEECDRLIAAANAKGALAAVAQVVRFFPEHERAHQAIVSGAIGRPASVRIRRGGKAPVGSASWFQDHERSGGVILDLAVHDIDWLLWTLGPITRVTARCTGLGSAPSPASAIGQHALMIFEHASGCVSHSEASWLDPRGFSTAIDACGSEGVVEFDSRTFAAVVEASGGEVKVGSPNSPEQDPYMRQLTAFLKMASEGAAPAVTLQEAREAVRVCMAAIESAHSGQPVRLDP
jgi:predicted dehydrogenase